jgi:hypothetical protein
MARKPPEPRDTRGTSGARRGRPPGKAGAVGPSSGARRGRPPGKASAGADAPPSRSNPGAKAPPKRAPVQRKASPAVSPARGGSSGRGRRTGAAALIGPIQQILEQLGELRGILPALQALSAKLDAVVLQQEGARDERDPGDAVPPGVAVQSPAPLSAEDEAVLEKLEKDVPHGEDREPRRSD